MPGTDTPTVEIGAQDELGALIQEFYHLHDEIGKTSLLKVEPYVQAVMNASGLSEFDGKRTVYWMLGALRLERFDVFPGLAFMGSSNTGKTRALQQMRRCLGLPPDFKITGTTYMHLGTELSDQPIAFIEEGEDLHPIDKCEYLLQKRTDRSQSSQIINYQSDKGMRPTPVDIFGATVIHKRGAFGDIATRNRYLVIPTKQKVGNWALSEVDSVAFHQLAEGLSLDPDDLLVALTVDKMPVGRTRDMMEVVVRVAADFSDLSFLEQARAFVRREMLKIVADDEPLELTAKAYFCGYLQAHHPHAEDVNLADIDFQRAVRLVDVTQASKSRLGVEKSSQFFKRNLRELGFEIGLYKGYDHVKANPMLARELVEQYGQQDETDGEAQESEDEGMA